MWNEKGTETEKEKTTDTNTHTRTHTHNHVIQTDDTHGSIRWPERIYYKDTVVVVVAAAIVNALLFPLLRPLRCDNDLRNQLNRKYLLVTIIIISIISFMWALHVCA